MVVVEIVEIPAPFQLWVHIFRPVTTKRVFFLAAALVLDSDHLAFDHLHHHRCDPHPVPPHRERHV